MTAIKVKEESRILLDLSSGKYSKNKIKRLLRDCKVAATSGELDDLTLYVNKIKIGAFTIELILPFDSPSSWQQISDYKDLSIAVYIGQDERQVYLLKEPIFKNQEWVQKNFFGNFRTKHLIEAISYCKRLDKIKAFL